MKCFARRSKKTVKLPRKVVEDMLEYVRKTSGPGDKSPIRSGDWEFLYAMEDALDGTKNG